MPDLGRFQRQARERSRWEDANDYFAEHSDSWEYDEVGRCVVERVEPHETVLEMGCGCGLVSFRIASSVASVRGYDLVVPMLESGRRHAASAGVENVEFLEGDVYRIPEPDGACDVVICAYLLDVVTDPVGVLREARRLVRPGGKLISVTDIHVGETGFKRRVRQLRASLRGWLRGRMESSRPSTEQLRAWHEAAGFDVRDGERWHVMDLLWNECLTCVASRQPPAS